MNTAKNRTANLNSRINTYIDELAALTDEARISTAMQAYLDACVRFHRYSPHNQLLIHLQRPDATRVAGYQAWKQFGRYVHKGEKGIPILAPLLLKDDDGSERVAGFRVVNVFDVAQTDGKPLPPQPEWKSPEENAELAASLMAFAEKQGIAVQVQALSNGAQGVSANGSVVVSPRAGTKTLVHELAHELLHWGDVPFERKVVEVEAEAVAYVVSRHFGLDVPGSANYLALWDADSDVIYVHFERISKCARRLIRAVTDCQSPPEEDL